MSNRTIDKTRKYDISQSNDHTNENLLNNYKFEKEEDKNENEITSFIDFNVIGIVFKILKFWKIKKYLTLIES